MLKYSLTIALLIACSILNASENINDEMINLENNICINTQSNCVNCVNNSATLQSTITSSNAGPTLNELRYSENCCVNLNSNSSANNLFAIETDPNNSNDQQHSTLFNNSSNSMEKGQTCIIINSNQQLNTGNFTEVEDNTIVINMRDKNNLLEKKRKRTKKMYFNKYNKKEGNFNDVLNNTVYMEMNEYNLPLDKDLENFKYESLYNTNNFLDKYYVYNKNKKKPKRTKEQILVRKNYRNNIHETINAIMDTGYITTVKNKRIKLHEQDTIVNDAEYNNVLNWAKYLTNLKQKVRQ